MISRLLGTVWEKELTSLTLNVHGVGYALQIPLSTFEKLPNVGEEADVLVYTQVRGDAITLYGFSTPEEKALFETLLAVSGIGGKLAIAILSGMPVANFHRAIANREITLLSKIPGIGKRTAERLVVELSGKLPAITGLSSASAASAADSPALLDAASALERLGFKREDALSKLRTIAATLPLDEQNSGNLLRQALRALSS